MTKYYTENLAAERLKLAYDIAPPKVKKYLETEINHVLRRIRSDDILLELGCGYGRVLAYLSQKAARVMGIDTSRRSLHYGHRLLSQTPNCALICADAVQLPFHDGMFDCVLCIQNGISAFKVEPRELILESLRIVKPGGKVIFSSYSEKFWEDRMDWFRLQSEAGLLGPIDEDKTGNGIIVCKDGFTARTISPDEFLTLTAGLGAEVKIEEVDDSSLFCELTLWHR